MSLVLTRYLDAEPAAISADLDRAIGVALDQAAERIAVARVPTSLEDVPDGVRLNAGLDVLDGSELRVTGGPRLTTVEVTVPWDVHEDAPQSKLLAANRFAHVVATELRVAA